MARTTIETIVKHDPSINSEGIFINMMTSFNRYIGEEFKSGRITGQQYAEVYLGGLTAVLANAIDYTKHIDSVNLQEARLELDRELGEARIDLERDLGEARIDLDRDLGEAQIALQQDKLALERELGRGQLALQQGKLALDRELGEAQLELQRDKLELERELNEIQKKLIQAQTQAFKARHQKDLAKLVFDTVTIGVTQEQMNVLAGPNAIFGGLAPKAEFEAARWVG